MEPWEKFWMVVLGFAFFGIGTTFINMYANGRYSDGVERGYLNGYSDAKANLCSPQYIGDCRPKKQPE